MTTNLPNERTPRKPLRVWPGVVAVVLQWPAMFFIPIVVPESAYIGMLCGATGGLAVLLWWLFFSRAPWWDRVGAIGVMVLGLLATSRLVHESIANGLMGMMLPIYAIPVLSLALVAWAVASRGLPERWRRGTMVAAILLACGAMTLVRTGGITGAAVSDLHWRWTMTPEERLLAQRREEPKAPASPQVAVDTQPEWPGFRGPERDGMVRGTRIASDWSRSAPVEVWRRPIGPGWSSFAVHGNFVFTQEQRGEEEAVSCYSLATGAPVWSHRDKARFWESNAGAGPRGTPTLSGGRLYTFGGTGILNVLDACNGSVVWSRNAAAHTGRKVPLWGFSSSPLLVGDLVIVATAGVLAAYDAGTGTERWVGPAGGGGYSSPHMATIDGVEQVLLLNVEGVVSVAPNDGKVLWSHSWKGDGIVQPTVLPEGDVLLGSGSGMASGVGLRRIAVTNGAAGWTVAERWTSTGIKPYFNDYIVHQGHAYGFDGSQLACIDLADGQRKWKGGRYGHGQLVGLPDQELLLVISEKGELALVSALPGQFRELARRPAIKGKTWNHPVLVGDLLLVRNAQEMAAFRLALAGS